VLREGKRRIERVKGDLEGIQRVWKCGGDISFSVVKEEEENRGTELPALKVLVGIV